jgi:hypothetical protein
MIRFVLLVRDFLSYAPVEIFKREFCVFVVGS